MEDWWKDLDFITLESITGLREADFSSEDSSTLATIGGTVMTMIPRENSISNHNLNTYCYG